MKREEFEEEDDQYHNMIMRYEWQHFYKTWEMKMKSIFGDSEEDDEAVVEGDYEWKPGDSLNRLNEQSFKENIKKM